MADQEGPGGLAMALKLLRKAAGFERHQDLAVVMRVDRKTVARLEQTEANPRWSTLSQRLAATKHSFFDLAAALRIVATEEAGAAPGATSTKPERWDSEIAWLARDLLDTRHDVNAARRENRELRRRLTELEEAFHEHRDAATLGLLRDRDKDVGTAPPEERRVKGSPPKNGVS